MACSPIPKRYVVSEEPFVDHLSEGLRNRIAAGELDPLQALLCNAGAQFRGPISYSKDGFEETFATNYLGHLKALYRPIRI